MQRSTSSRAVLGAAVLLAALQLAPSARADCFPTCREGFTCRGGRCVEASPAPACFPPCRSGYTCRDARCEQDGAASPSAPSPSPSPSQRPLLQPPTVDPAAPDPAPIDPAGAQRWAEEVRQRDAIREGLKVGVRASIGYYVADELVASSPTMTDGYGAGLVLTGPGPAFTLGLGLRKNVTRIFGVSASARATVYLYEAEAPEFAFFGGAAAYTSEGVGLRTFLDLTLRLGPFGADFPMFVGLGAMVGADTVFGSGAVDTSFGVPAKDYSETHLRGGPLLELGFIFGAQEQIELGARFEMWAADTGRETIDSVGLHLDFGWSWP